MSESTDIRKNIKTVDGDICRECIIHKIIPTRIWYESVVNPFPKLEYTDTQQLFHSHNMDITVNTYHCDNGHTWTVNISMNKCWCIIDRVQPIRSLSITNTSQINYLRNSPRVKILRHNSDNT